MHKGGVYQTSPGKLSKKTLKKWNQTQNGSTSHGLGPPYPDYLEKKHILLYLPHVDQCFKLKL